MPKDRQGKSRKSEGLPDRQALLDYIRESGEADKNAIAKAFRLKGEDRRALREMLKSLQDEGVLGKRGRKGFAEAGALPPVGVADVVERDIDGDLYVRFTKGDETTPLVRLAPDPKESAIGAPGLGDRLLVRFDTAENGEHEARLIKKIGGGPTKQLGVIRRHRKEVRVEPIDRKVKDSLVLIAPDPSLKDGDLVIAAATSQPGRRYGPKAGKVLEVVGQEDDPRAASLIAIHAHGIPIGFSEAAEKEAAAAKEPELKGREDLRKIPFITIDPADARDHDDAVYAEPDPDTGNTGGWIVWVAIADVAAYVRTGTALDHDAANKGNSTYFPDRVEPMLPETLSAGLCSLREGENRACLAARMVFDKSGRKKSHTFVRGLIRSAAKLTYQEAQKAFDGQPDDKTGPLNDHVLKPLWEAYEVVLKGRKARAPLSIESTERRIEFGEDGKIASIKVREQIESMRLIEEFMIQANVCAAETLEKARVPAIYRIHDAPSFEKLQNLADFLYTIGIPWTKGAPATTARFNELLDETREGPHGEIVNEVVLRTQMQAVYSTDNIGHFGLHLSRYAHFTSPIRRYADLTVHRGIIRALKLGNDGLTDEEIAKLDGIADEITMTERRSMAAERDATDRYVAAFLSDRVGAEFVGRVTGVTRFGLFVRLEDTGADGLVPVSSLGDEYFIHDDRAHALVGERSGERFPLGMVVQVRLIEATPITGGLVFEMLSDPLPRDPKAPAPRLGVRRRGSPKGGPKKGGRKGGRRK